MNKIRSYLIPIKFFDFIEFLLNLKTDTVPPLDSFNPHPSPYSVE